MQKTKIIFEKKGKNIIWFWNLQELEDWFYECKKRKQIRSPEQNRMYFWYIIKRIAMEYKNNWILHTSKYIHWKLRDALIPRKQIRSDFNKRKYVWKNWSTTTLTTKPFSEYIEMIKALCEFQKLGEIPGLENIEWFVIKDIWEEELLDWIDKII